MTTFSGHKDLAYGTVLTAPSPALSGTSLTLSAGAGALMPSTLPFYATAAPPSVLPTHANAEVVSVTNVVGDVLTIVRAQGGTTAQSIAAGWQFFASVTSEWADEIEAAINAGSSPTGAAGGDLAGTYPDPDLATIGVATGPLGDGTNVAVVTIDSKGRVVALTSTPITGASPTGSAGGVLDGTYPSPGLAAGVAGDGLTETADVLSVNTDGSTIDTSADALRVKPLGITDAQVAVANKDGLAAVASMRTLGTGSAQAAAGDDARITGAVQKSLFDANTILAANTDDTPAALTMGASTILARLAAGNIKAASVSEINTMLGAPNMSRSARASNTILAAADKGTVIAATAAFTQTLTAAATLGAGWWCIIQNNTQDGTTVLTVDPNGSETIDGLTTATMYSGEMRLLECDGSNFTSQLLSGGYAKFTPTGGTFVVPAGIEQAKVMCVGSGGGGCGGPSNSTIGTNSAFPGASGGGGGAVSNVDFTAAALGAAGTSITVTVNAGGAGGAGRSAGAGGNGSGGSNGANSSFGSLAVAGGGGGGTAVTGGGGGGELSSGATTTGGQPVIRDTNANGISGGSGLSSAASTIGNADRGGAGGGPGVSGAAGKAGGSSIQGGPGGGAGGGSDIANTAFAGAAGGSNRAYTSGGGAAGGANTGAVGTDGATGPNPYCGGGGGGGGAKSIGGGGNGGAGGIGGGGGGGGVGTNTVNSGNKGGDGGAGGPGEVRVWYS